jgi:integrase/recombinase XerD
MNRFFKDIKSVKRMEESSLSHYLLIYAEHLYTQGYTRQSGRRKLQLVADFGRWMKQRGLRVNQLIDKHVKDFLRFRQGSGLGLQRSDRAAITDFFKLLRQRRVIKEQLPRSPITPSQGLLRDYDSYLHKERCLSLATRLRYTPLVLQFLVSQFGSGRVDLSRLRATDVLKFVQRRAAELKNKRTQLMTTALRSFLRFARYRGEITLDLASCVPSIASCSLSSIPKSLSLAQVEQVLSVIRNRSNALGRRDYAILLLLARLGLRSGEVCKLTLEDIDWENSRITIRGKADRVAQLPIPAEVGEAITAYLQDGRPREAAQRRLFIRIRAPLVGFKGQGSVGAVVKHALQRARVNSPRQGAHLFRHTLASTMLQNGSSLSEIGQLLRHRHPDTTAIYAKVDILSLQSLALPWPGGAHEQV